MPEKVLCTWKSLMYIKKSYIPEKVLHAWKSVSHMHEKVLRTWNSHTHIPTWSQFCDFERCSQAYISRLVRFVKTRTRGQCYDFINISANICLFDQKCCLFMTKTDRNIGFQVHSNKANFDFYVYIGRNKSLVSTSPISDKTVSRWCMNKILIHIEYDMLTKD
jgi:hypothetical protein